MQASKRQQPLDQSGRLVLAQDTGSVHLTLDNGDTVDSRWLVGCDGASSWTRRTATARA